MATAIASIPVLTGEVAQKFEAQAEKAYQEHLKPRTPAQREAELRRYEQGIQMVKDILAKSELRP